MSTKPPLPPFNKEKKLKNVDDQINIESKNSCLNKSLCRG